MPLIRITELDDPRVALYRNLKDKLLDRSHDRFLAEGQHVVVRLLRSSFETESLLVDERRLRMIDGEVGDDVPVYVARHGLLDQIAGYTFHAGVLAVGRRPRPLGLDDVMGRYPVDQPLTVVIAANLNNAENLGTVFRTAAGFGAACVVLGEESHDPYYRQSIRVSMGAVFHVPIVRSVDLATDLRRLREHWRVQVAATVLADDAEDLYHATRPPRFAIMLGSEDQGLPDDLVAASDRKVTLPMRLRTDSLNVSVATGIFLYHFTQPGVMRGEETR
jgi:tRNA G18 (ribose-2'-O)-methylase SpoU